MLKYFARFTRPQVDPSDLARRAYFMGWADAIRLLSSLPPDSHPELARTAPAFLQERLSGLVRRDHWPIDRLMFP